MEDEPVLEAGIRNRDLDAPTFRLDQRSVEVIEVVDVQHTPNLGEVAFLFEARSVFDLFERALVLHLHFDRYIGGAALLEVFEVFLLSPLTAYDDEDLGKRVPLGNATPAPGTPMVLHFTTASAPSDAS